MMKRTLMTSLSLVLALGLAACGNGNSGGNAAEGKGEGAKAGSGEKTKISYWTGDRHDADFIKEKVAEFNASNPDGIEVELVVKGDDFDTALDLSFQTSDAPDVIRAKENTIQTFYKKAFSLRLTSS